MRLRLRQQHDTVIYCWCFHQDNSHLKHSQNIENNIFILMFRTVFCFGLNIQLHLSSEHAVYVHLTGSSATLLTDLDLPHTNIEPSPCHPYLCTWSYSGSSHPLSTWQMRAFFILLIWQKMKHHQRQSGNGMWRQTASLTLRYFHLP